MLIIETFQRGCSPSLLAAAMSEISDSQEREWTHEVSILIADVGSAG
jgi:hypothetical protein